MNRLAYISKTILLTFFCFTASGLSAQYEYSIKNFNTENGLPLNEVTAMTMDHDGYLWVGTRNGLVRYDGSAFRTFQFESNNNNISANYIINTINTLYDKKTIVRTRAGFAYLIENGKPVLYIDTSGFKDAWAMFNGNFPSLDIFYSYYIVNKSDGGFANWINLYREIIPVDKRTFIYGSAGSSNMAYMKDGVRERPMETGIKVQQFLSSGGSHFLLDEEGIMYLYDSLSKGFNKIKADPGIFKKAGIAPTELRIFSDDYSHQSFCLYNGSFYLLQFDAANNTMKFLPQFSINDRRHFWTGIVYDSLHSTFFLSTQNEGFFQVKLKKIKTFNIYEMSPNADQSSVTNYAVLKTSDSTVIIPSGFQFTAGSSGIGVKKLGNIFSERETIALEGEKNILTTYLNNIYTYSPADGYRARKVYNDSFTKKNYVTKIELIYPEGDSLWVGTDNQLFCIAKNKSTLLFDKNRAGDEEYEGLRLFYRINNSEAYIAGYSGLFRLTTTYPFATKKIAEMANKEVRHISPYKDMFILSVYREGLYLLKGGQFYKVPVRPDQPELSSCHSTCIDKNGFIWIPTDKGLYKSTVASIVESALTPGSNYPFFFSYGKADGIDNIEFNGKGMPTYAILNKGQAFYPSMGGVVTFNLNELNDRIVNSPAIIEKIVIDNNETGRVSDSIYLKANFKYLAIDLSVANFSDPKNICIEYNLDSTGWKKVLVGENQRITLVDINSGRHLLVIRKRTGFGNEDYIYKTITIIREKSIYEKVWFYIVLAAILSFLAWLFLHLKTRSIRRKKAALQKKVDEQTAELSKEVEVKDLLISIISHDMTTPLRHISLVSGILAKGLEKDPEKAREALTDIRSTSEKILSGSLTIINWMKYNNKKITVEKKSIHLCRLVNEVLEIYMPVAKSKDISLMNDVPKSKFAEADHTILATILNNLISNAIKHTAKGEIRISFEKPGSDTKAVLKISDTGSGMSEKTLYVIREVLRGNLHVVKTTDKINTGLGYVMIAELLKIHDFSLSVESSWGKGTIISLAID